MAEWLDVVDENGAPTGETVERERAHREGFRHRTAHVWLLRRRGGRVEILLQMRSREKDSFPGCYDISSAGHIPAGQSVTESALRELREELGVTVEAGALIPCGQRRFFSHLTFRGQPFLDNQISDVFCLWLDRDEKDFTVQKSEVEYVRWMEFDACIRAVTEGSIPSAISLEELEMVRRKL